MRRFVRLVWTLKSVWNLFQTISKILLQLVLGVSDSVNLENTKWRGADQKRLMDMVAFISKWRAKNLPSLFHNRHSSNLLWQMRQKDFVKQSSAFVCSFFVHTAQNQDMDSSVETLWNSCVPLVFSKLELMSSRIAKTWTPSKQLFYARSSRVSFRNTWTFRNTRVITHELLVC